MPKMEIDLPEISAETFYDDVVKSAASSLLNRTSYDEDGNPCSWPSTLAKDIREAVIAEVREQAVAATPGIVDKILAGEVVTTDRWGDRTGKRMTVKDIVAEEVKHTVEGRNRNHADILSTRIQRTVQTLFTEHIDEVSAAVAEPIMAAVRDEAVGVYERAAAKVSKGLVS